MRFLNLNFLAYFISEFRERLGHTETLYMHAIMIEGFKLRQTYKTNHDQIYDSYLIITVEILRKMSEYNVAKIICEHSKKYQ